jgi:ribosomal protein L37AE/L43A
MSLFKSLHNFIEDVHYARVARKAKKAEDEGNFDEAGRLACELERANRCLICGSKQFFEKEYYAKTGIWACPKCTPQVKKNKINPK